MNDLAFMVQEQGEMLDDIEANLDKVQNYIGKANKNLILEKKDH